MVFNGFKDKLAKLVFLTQGQTEMPKNFYIGFSKTPPTEDGGNITEPSLSAGYSKQKLELSEPTKGVCTNTNQIDYGEATEAWGAVTHTVIFDEKGTPLFSDPISSQIDVVPGDVVRIKVGNAKLYFGDAVVWA